MKSIEIIEVFVLGYWAMLMNATIFVDAGLLAAG